MTEPRCRWSEIRSFRENGVVHASEALYPEVLGATVGIGII